jgi:hypothetical protein
MVTHIPFFNEHWILKLEYFTKNEYNCKNTKKNSNTFGKNVNLETKIQKIHWKSRVWAGSSLNCRSSFWLWKIMSERFIELVKKTECQNFCCSRDPNFASQTEFFYSIMSWNPRKKNPGTKKLRLVKNSIYQWIRTRDISRDVSVALPMRQDVLDIEAVFESLI